MALFSNNLPPDRWNDERDGLRTCLSLPQPQPQPQLELAEPRRRRERMKRSTMTRMAMKAPSMEPIAIPATAPCESLVELDKIGLPGIEEETELDGVEVC